jgi:hypothetical protein
MRNCLIMASHPWCQNNVITEEQESCYFYVLTQGVRTMLSLRHKIRVTSMFLHKAILSLRHKNHVNSMFLHKAMLSLRNRNHVTSIFLHKAILSLRSRNHVTSMFLDIFSTFRLQQRIHFFYTIVILSVILHSYKMCLSWQHFRLTSY